MVKWRNAWLLIHEALNVGVTMHPSLRRHCIPNESSCSHGKWNAILNHWILASLVWSIHMEGKMLFNFFIQLKINYMKSWLELYRIILKRTIIRKKIYQFFLKIEIFCKCFFLIWYILSWYHLITDDYNFNDYTNIQYKYPLRYPFFKFLEKQFHIKPFLYHL